MVRQTETAAIRKSGKASSSSTFQRSVANVFTIGTIIDDDDPSFSDLLQRSYSAPAVVESGDGDDEGPGDDDTEEMTSADWELGDNDECYIVSITESIPVTQTRTRNRECTEPPVIISGGDDGFNATVISVVALNVKAHCLRYESLYCHNNAASRQQLLDVLDIIQVNVISSVGLLMIRF